MASSDLKEQVLAYVDQADDHLLQIIKKLSEIYFRDEAIVAFHPNGVPMTKKEYKKALDIAEAQILEGDFISVEEFEKLIDE